MSGRWHCTIVWRYDGDSDQMARVRLWHYGPLVFCFADFFGPDIRPTRKTICKNARDKKKLKNKNVKNAKNTWQQCVSLFVLTTDNKERWRTDEYKFVYRDRIYTYVSPPPYTTRKCNGQVWVLTCPRLQGDFKSRSVLMFSHILTSRIFVIFVFFFFYSLSP